MSPRGVGADRGLVPRLSYAGSGQPVGTVSAVEQAPQAQPEKALPPAVADKGKGKGKG